jgi:phosphate acyltransferase
LDGITIALDVMGGDKGPHVSVPAIKQALNIYADLNLIVFGDEREVLPLLRGYKVIDNSRLSFIHVPGIVSAGENPIHALRHGRNTSLWKAIEAVSSKIADGAVSSGSTGAMVAMANHLIGTLPLVHRSALVQIMPSLKTNGTVFLDLGANLRVDAQMLYQYAVMGNILAINLLKLDNPKVSLLNVGRENSKGPELIHEAAALIKSNSALNYIGFTEGDDLFTGVADVIVTDGFTGNVALKTAEGVYRVLEQRMRGKGLSHYFLFSPIKSYIKRKIGLMQPDAYNGSTLLGLDGVVVKSHGSASPRAFANAIAQAYGEIQHHVPKLIANGLIQL